MKSYRQLPLQVVVKVEEVGEWAILGDGGVTYSQALTSTPFRYLTADDLEVQAAALRVAGEAVSRVARAIEVELTFLLPPWRVKESGKEGDAR